MKLYTPADSHPSFPLSTKPVSKGSLLMYPVTLPLCQKATKYHVIL